MSNFQGLVVKYSSKSCPFSSRWFTEISLKFPWFTDCTLGENTPLHGFIAQTHQQQIDENGRNQLKQHNVNVVNHSVLRRYPTWAPQHHIERDFIGHDIFSYLQDLLPINSEILAWHTYVENALSSETLR